MAREGLRSHLSGSVPVSIVVHLVVLLVLVVIPLTNIVVPIPALMMPSFVLAAPLPPPPEFVRRPLTASPAPSPSPAAPTSAPPSIEPEKPVSPPSIQSASDGVPGGVSGFGGEVGSVGMPAGPPPPPEPPHVQGPVRVALLPEPPRKTVEVRPIYPEVARVARKEGIVILEAVLDTNGRVTQLRVIRSEPLLDQAAIDAVRQWRYTPSMYYGKPVSVLMTITVRFTLQQ
jgi:periplasmic protein TonB